MKRKVDSFLYLHGDIIIKLLVVVIGSMIAGGCLGGWAGVKIGIGVAACGVTFAGILAFLSELVNGY